MSFLSQLLLDSGKHVRLVGCLWGVLTAIIWWRSGEYPSEDSQGEDDI